jgi:FKBP-type peptidyl-prolyl cis-trans isomerase
MRRLLALVGLALVAGGCGYPEVPVADTSPVATTVKTQASAAPGADDFNEGSGKKATKLPDGLQYIDLKIGTGVAVRKNDRVSMQYTGWLTDGKKFDSSRDRDQPFEVTLGKGEVIPGWDEGIPGMKLGGRRKLIIPYQLAYGEQGQEGSIPPRATLIFIVELVEINPTPSPSPSPAG